MGSEFLRDSLRVRGELLAWRGGWPGKKPAAAGRGPRSDISCSNDRHLPMKRSVSVQIAGQKYTLRSDAEESEVKALAAFVDGRFRQIQRQTRHADTQALAIMTALQIAEVLFGERKETAALKRQIREKGRSLLQFLEREGGV